MRGIVMALVCAPFLWGWIPGASAGDVPCAGAAPAMTVARLGQIVTALDPSAVQHGYGWRMQIGGQVTLLTADAAAGRLRAMMPIGRAGDMDEADLRRMMQANFDSALDGRYAIARGLVWSVFVHPLRGLEKNHLIGGLAQAATLARTHGTIYSGGGAQFGGGDSPELQRDLLDELLKRGEDL
jgi:hypothetical protein